MTGYVHGLELTDAWTTPGKIRKQARAFTEGTLEWHQQTLQFDLMRDYRNTIPVEEQDKLWEEVGEKLEERDEQMRKVAELLRGQSRSCRETALVSCLFLFSGSNCAFDQSCFLLQIFSQLIEL